MSAPTVTVFISSSLNSFRSEKRYSRSLTIAEFKVWPWGRARRAGPGGWWAGLEVRVQRLVTSLRGVGVHRVGAGPREIRGSGEPRGRVPEGTELGGSRVFGNHRSG